MQLNTPALVIKTADVGENDRLLTLLTRENGVITAFASGAKKYKHKNYAGTTFLAYSDFLIEFVKGTYRVREATVIRSFFKLGCDYEILSLEQYFCEIAAVLSPRDMGADEYLKLMLNTLHYLSFKPEEYYKIKAVFEMRMLCLAGYMPDFVGCSVCGTFNENGMYFDLNEGILFCDECKSGFQSTFLNPTVLFALRHIVYSEDKKIFSFTVPEEYAVSLSKITQKYLLLQTEHNFHTLNFLK